MSHRAIVSRYTLAGVLCAGMLGAYTTQTFAGSTPPSIRNGDTNGDGELDISDVIHTLLYLFQGGAPPAACTDSPETMARLAELESEVAAAKVELEAASIALEATEQELERVRGFFPPGPLYTLVELGSVWNDTLSTVPNDLNDAGQIVGTSTRAGDQRRAAWLWQDGELTALEPDLDGSQAQAVNEAGQIIGMIQDPAACDSLPWSPIAIWNGDSRSVLCGTDNISGTFMDINDLGSSLFATARATEAGNVRTTWLYHEGIYTEVALYEAYAVNSAEQVVGFISSATDWNAALWEAGNVTDIGSFGGHFSFAFSINELGHVVGYSENSSGVKHAFLWMGGDMIDLGAGEADDINELGDIVGRAPTGTCNDAESMVLWKDGQVFDLYTRIAPGTIAGWGDLYPAAINNEGQIAGWGRLNGRTHAFLLNPVQP